MIHPDTTGTAGTVPDANIPRRHRDHFPAHLPVSLQTKGVVSKHPDCSWSCCYWKGRACICPSIPIPFHMPMQCLGVGGGVVSHLCSGPALLTRGVQAGRFSCSVQINASEWMCLSYRQAHSDMSVCLQLPDDLLLLWLLLNFHTDEHQ